MVVEFECRKCGKVFPHEQYNKSRFCPNCGTYLTEKIIYQPSRRNGVTHVEQIREEDINLEAIFFKFNKLRPIFVGEGKYFNSVDSWVSARKNAYRYFREKFSNERILDFNYLSKTYKEWLLFKNNLSWTTLYRSGYKALETPDRLAELIIFLRDDEINVKERVKRGLEGKEKVQGIGQGILTALLHTFFEDKYCVWNSRTQETLELLRCSIPKKFSNIGKAYVAVNNKCHELATRLDTDLTTIDGLMWYVSKLEIIKK
jgi:predicted RNA-binding Zn-ribbon protein involved in translation (DUF1610 family)